MGHVGSKDRLIGQILEKLCVSSRGHIVSGILMKLGQTVCLDGMKSWASLKMGHIGSKTRSLGQILENLSVPSSRHIFNLILMKHG